MTLPEVQEATHQDSTLEALKGLLRKNRWHTLQTPDTLPARENLAELKAYSKIR